MAVSHPECRCRIVYGPMDMTLGDILLEELADRGRAPTALYCPGLYLAWHTAMALKKLSCRVPEDISMLINEQIFISLVSIALGVGAGILTSRLYIPLVQIAYASADTVIPLEIVAKGSDMAKLLIVVAVMVILCMAVLGVLISRIRISQALKLGED